jgi:hypothetical protein
MPTGCACAASVARAQTRTSARSPENVHSSLCPISVVLVVVQEGSSARHFSRVAVHCFIDVSLDLPETFPERLM